ncbi:MAG: PAS domain S-box protein, partial [Dehalococcoidales bacterium]|nr:PAS domain S-box protein [Dehalococcoidales bacterium]
IDEQALANEELKDGLERRRELEKDLLIKNYAIEAAAVGIGITDLKGNLTYANEALLQMGGYESAEVLGKHATVFLDDRETMEAALKAGVEKGSWQGELKVNKKDGSAYYAVVWANLVKDNVGEPVCLMASIVDITERKQMEEQLARQASVLNTVMENIGTMLVYLDRDFNFIMANKAYINSCGHTWEELKGKNHFDFFPNEENEAIFRKVRETGETVFFHDKPFEYADQPGRSVTYWDWTLVPIKDSSGVVTGLVFSLIETTERKKAEQIKDEFIGMVSHELRTPLTVFLGAVKTAMAEGITVKDSRELLKDASQSAESMAHLVDNLLELSRYQSNRLTLNLNKINSAKVISEVVEKEKSHLGSHRLSVDIAENLPPVEADQVRLEQILINLLDNAAKYSPDNTEIRISAKQDSDHLLIGVKDKGKGIPQDEKDKLFQPFERLNETSVTRPGLGLGLLVCRRLVEAQGGRIWVDSKAGKGSTFWFTLPIAHRSS